MTFYFPDVSHHKAGLQIQPKTVAVLAKATEGKTFTDSSYADFRVQAAAVGAVFAGYHWLWPHGSSSIAAQAQHALSVVGKTTPLMIDAEEPSAALSVQDIADFIDEYRRLGGRVRLVYLPHWYWQRNMGSPSLAPLAQRQALLVASEYRTYSDANWPGGYGGMTPYVWQYTNGLSYGGQKVDFNACKDTVPGFAAAIGADVPAPAPAPGKPTAPAALAVDGVLGPKTISRWQQVIGTPVDGIISTPSVLVRAVQGRLNSVIHGGLVVDGVGIRQDGHTVYATTRALQRYLGTAQDGILSTPASECVKALQKRLNTGRF